MSGLGGLDPIRSLAGGHALSAVLRAAAQPKPHHVIAAGIASPRAQRRQVLRVEREAPWRTMQTAFVAPPPPWLAQIAPLADWAHQWGNPCDGVLAVICRGALVAVRART